MSALDRMLVTVAVAVSPLAHRLDRREQWLADVSDARELNLSPTSLAFGALTTALFHRRAGQQSTWGNAMNTTPGTMRRTSHTIPTIPVLLAVAIASFLAGSIGLGLVQRYNGIADGVPMFALISIALTVVPGLAVGASVLLVIGAPFRRRAFGALIVFAVSALWWVLMAGYFNLPIHPSLSLGIIAASWLAVWLVVLLRRPGWTWTLLLLPLVASVLVFPLANAVYTTALAFSLKAAVATVVDVIPFLVAVLAAVIARRTSAAVPSERGQRDEIVADTSA